MKSPKMPCVYSSLKGPHCWPRDHCRQEFVRSGKREQIIGTCVCVSGVVS
jgi:hypothetical protein